jgi:hypothetical protein
MTEGRLLAGDLAWLVMKALEKDRNRRPPCGCRPERSLADPQYLFGATRLGGRQFPEPIACIR